MHRAVSLLLVLSCAIAAGVGGMTREPLVRIDQPDGGDSTREMSHRRNQASSTPGVGPYSGITIVGPSGVVTTGDGGGSGPGAWSNEGSSGMIITGNAVPTESPADTEAPTNGVVVESPVQITISGVPSGYRLPAPMRESIISFVHQMLQTNLDGAFQLVDVSYAGILLCQSNGGQTSDGCVDSGSNSLSIPLR